MDGEDDGVLNKVYKPYETKSHTSNEEHGRVMAQFYRLEVDTLL